MLYAEYHLLLLFVQKEGGTALKFRNSAREGARSSPHNPGNLSSSYLHHLYYPILPTS